MPWYYGTKVVGLYTQKYDKWSWALFKGGGISGWRLLYPGNDDAVVNMTTMLTHAKAEDRHVDIEVDGSDRVITIYVW